ncbi:hypothetical protein CKO11_14705 [Rhodobacter sp. TJ_12]|uniref:SufD family Fe-S cluster assembly protein n=1 Tax=Rhodobacter sp. TJ_12 TaxID=2029399 RepID=UPI001CBF7616|nr:SufD family Fe-S cluster assembly protein [Rhodobacter sp. TJ_12]MBZ4023701.1 hypothetical protein [Rhodobacter sp. TJ_12]
MNEALTSPLPLSNAERALLHEVGFADESLRTGTAVLIDDRMRVAQSNIPDQLEILPLAQALETHDFVQDLMFGLVGPEANADIRAIADTMQPPLGHFIWVKAGAKLRLPVQCFSMIETPQARQFTHDITLIEAGAEVEMIGGAMVPPALHRGRHITLSETYLRAGARCTSVGIEHWAPGMEVHSYSFAQLETGAQSDTTAILLAPIREHVAQSRTELGADAISSTQTVVFAPEGTHRRIDSETRLTAPGARAKEITRMVSTGGEIDNLARMIGAATQTEGFLGCDGLKLTDQGAIRAVPALDAQAEGTALSHEASVGRIDGEKLAYLMASGMEEEAARNLIVQGFLAPAETRMPEDLRDRVAAMIVSAKSGGM